MKVGNELSGKTQWEPSEDLREGCREVPGLKAGCSVWTQSAWRQVGQAGAG